MISVKMLLRELHAFDNNIIQHLHTDHFTERAKYMSIYITKWKETHIINITISSDTCGAESQWTNSNGKSKR